jgi:geranylgeranylglycerol-phosphate geranylgeranyltransferase
MSFTRLKAVAGMIRPVNCAMMVAAVYVASVVALRSLVEPSPRLVSAFITAFTLTGFAMVVNDIYDVEVDRINEPKRALPSGALKTNQAWVYAIILAIVGFSLSVYDGWFEAFLAAFSVCLSILYSAKLKLGGLSGNLAVSYNVALPFLYGGIVVHALNDVLAIFFLLAFLSNTGREVIKGISEIRGDAVREAKTVARKYGSAKAAKVGAAFSVCAAALSPIPLFLGGLSPVGYGVPLILTDALFIFLAYKLVKQPSQAGYVKKMYKLPMLIAMLSFVTGALI